MDADKYVATVQNALAIVTDDMPLDFNWKGAASSVSDALLHADTQLAEAKQAIDAANALADQYFALATKNDEQATILQIQAREALDLAETIKTRCEAAELSRDTFKAQAADLEQRKDGAYLERNQLVALLARLFPSGIKRTAIEGWSDDWHGCVYIELPTGQASWHYHDSHHYLFDKLPPYQGEWDGHSTPEKYERVMACDKTDQAAEAEARAAAMREAIVDLLHEMDCLMGDTDSNDPGDSAVLACQKGWKALEPDAGGMFLSRLQRAEEALNPFARAAAGLVKEAPDDIQVLLTLGSGVRPFAFVRVSDIRSAAKAPAP